jgi:hypothetical protein
VNLYSVGAMPISRNSARTDFNDALSPSELSSILILVAGIILRIACAASADNRPFSHSYS